MRARLALGLVSLVVVLAAPLAHAEVLPAPPPLPPPPKELEPLLELLAGPAGVLTEPGCAALGTVLGLGAIAVPGVPGTLEAQTGISLATLPIALQPELLRLVDTLLFVQGAGCGLLPLAAERMVCASDDDYSAALDQIRPQLNLAGLPVQLGDFVPVPPPTVGSVVDTVRTLATLGVPGAAETAAALAQVGDCGLRSRFTNVHPPPVPPEPVPAPLEAVPAAAPPAHLPAAARLFDVPLVSPRAPVSAVVVAPTSPSGSSRVPEDALPGWLQLLAVVALVAFLYRSLAPSPGG